MAGWGAFDPSPLLDTLGLDSPTRRGFRTARSANARQLNSENERYHAGTYQPTHAPQVYADPFLQSPLGFGPPSVEYQLDGLAPGQAPVPRWSWQDHLEREGRSAPAPVLTYRSLSAQPQPVQVPPAAPTLTPLAPPVGPRFAGVVSGIDADRQLVEGAVNSVAARVAARAGGTPPPSAALQSEVVAPPFPPRFDAVLNGINADRQLVGNAVNSVAAGVAERSLPVIAPAAAAPVVAAAQRVPVAAGTVLADPWGDFGTVPVLQRRPGQDGSAAHPTALQAVADLASNGLDLLEPPSISTKQSGRPVQELSSAYTPRPIPSRGPVLEVGPATPAAGAAGELANVSGGGAGTSTAKGAAATAKQVAKRGLLQRFDQFVTNPARSVGVASEQGLRDTAAYLFRKKMPGLAGMAKNLAPVARWAAPTAAFGAAVGLPAITGAMEGNDKAGAGGAVLQGGGALAGALIGQTVIPLPFIGAAVGSMIGNAVGGGLASGAAGLVEKAQAGDTGVLGNIGRALDPFVDTAFEKQQQAAMQQMNSPAMRMIRDQETARVEQARADQAHAVLMQAYLQQIR